MAGVQTDCESPCQLSIDQIRLCRRQFEAFDLNGDGVISSSELYQVSHALGYSYTREQIKHILTESDLDGNGTISFDEFLQTMSDIMNSSQHDKMKAEVKRMFLKHDRDQNGEVSMEEAHHVLERELAFTPKQSIELVRCYDKNGDGQLSYEEFVDFYANVKSRAAGIQAMFVEFDKDKSGSISLEEAKTMLQRLGISAEEVETLVKIHDRNNDGQLQYDEFVAFLLRS